MKQYMTESLRRFITDEGVNRVETDGSRIWKTMYKEAQTKSKPLINVVFCTHQGPDVNETIMGIVGYVLAIPAYWIDIDTDLAVTYIGSMVDKYISTYYNDDGSLKGSTGTGGDDKHHHGHNHGVMPPPKPPIPGPPPPRPPHGLLPDKDMTPEETAGAVGEVVPSFTYESNVPQQILQEIKV